MANCAAASRKECAHARGSHRGSRLLSCVAEQLQENLSGPLDADGVDLADRARNFGGRKDF